LVVIETDFLIALISKGDKHHSEVKEILEKLSKALLSPYSFIELDLLINSGVLKVKPSDFYRALANVLTYYGVFVPRIKPGHLMRAWDLRNRYNLTFFDSLHAAVAIEESEVLMSYDRVYSIVKELKYLHPRDFLANFS